MAFIGQYDPATRLPTCNYCGVVVEQGLAYDACDACDTRNLFSDFYKDENGFRPDLTQWSVVDMKVYLQRRWDA